MNLNAAYLGQRFKQVMSLNLSDYTAAARIQRAKQLLSSTTMKIFDVARLSGYQSPKHFMLVCKQKTGQTPGEYW
ncbi:helix-turn-helix domain-containing protein [Paenibacillus chitinolyticus]